MDIYSSNEIWPEKLKALSLAEDTGLRLAKLLIAGPAGTSMSAPIGDFMRDYAPEDLRHMNRGTLHAMAITDPLIEAFLTHPLFSPRQETILVRALADMEGVVHRGKFLEVAITAESEAEALFFQQVAEMLRAYHQLISPLTEIIVIDGNLIVGYTKEQHLTAMLPVSHLPWRQDVEQAANALSTWDSPGQEAEQVEIWLTGRATPRAFSQLLTKGFTIHEENEISARLHLTLLQNKATSAQSTKTIPDSPPQFSSSSGTRGKRAPAPSIERNPDVKEKELQKETKTTALRGDDERLRPEDQLQFSIGQALLTVTGEVSLDLALEDNFNLRSTRPEDRFDIEPEGKLNLIVEFPAGVAVFTEFGMVNLVRFEKTKKPMNTYQFQLREAFVQTPLPFSFPTLLRVGRQQVFEPRRWVLNETLDAVQLLLDPAPFHVRLAATTSIPGSGNRQRVFDNIFDARDQVDFIIFNSFDLTEDSTIGQYAIFGSKHQDRIVSRDPRDENPIWIGFRIFGKERFAKKHRWLKFDFLEDLFRPKIRYWFDFAYVTGTVKDKEISGWGLDVGASYIAQKLSFDPYLTAGYAFGSGDRDRADGVDRDFRQTSFQSNSGKFGGVVNFDYYGVLMDPELSNLHIYTLGIGFRPWPQSSIDLVYHHYEQAEAFDEFRDAEVDEPRGRTPNLGNEIDVIFGYRAIKNVRIRSRNGYFLPGPAYRRGRDDPAFFAKIDVQLSF